ncbi:hypothetical protein BdWA1_002870 [Babesia duncani]|uniref:Uncharacterized protein n=1 Tax=Babesia duncani TaxID=323732 RepID=A0AAD9PIR2_9APIC|nr:hypothetical protein BdWA1_002870 [Babesia duncani]
MNYLFTIFMLFCMHFSQQYELVSLDIDKRSFEFEPKDLVMPESFVPRYIEAYKSKRYKNNPFLISLLLEDITSSNWYSYFFISKNDKFVNFKIPKMEQEFEKVTLGFATYYKDSEPFSIHFYNKNLNSIISKDNSTTQDGSAIEEIDMKSIQIKFKFKLESGFIATCTSEYKGTFSDRHWWFRWFGYCMRKCTKEPYRYKLVRERIVNNDNVKNIAVNNDNVKNVAVNNDNVKNVVVNNDNVKNVVVNNDNVKNVVVNNDNVKNVVVNNDNVKNVVVNNDNVKNVVVNNDNVKNVVVNNDNVKNVVVNNDNVKNVVDKSTTERISVKEEPEQDNVVTGKLMQDPVAEESIENIDVSEEHAEDPVAEESTENIDVSEEHPEDPVAEESTENIDVSEEHAEDPVGSEGIVEGILSSLPGSSGSSSGLSGKNAFASSPSDLFSALRGFKPTMFYSVPKSTTSLRSSMSMESLSSILSSIPDLETDMPDY